MNFFKNAIIYRLTNTMALMAQLPTLEDSLCAFQFMWFTGYGAYWMDSGN